MRSCNTEPSLIFIYLVITWAIVSLVGTCRAGTLPNIPNIRPYDFSRFGYCVSGKFGEDRGGYIHLAIDYALPYDTTVNATSDGIISWSAMRGNYGYLIIIDHGNGLHTYYAHLSKPLVLEGTTVKKGQYIAKSGSSGTAQTPAHLHYSCYKEGMGFVFPYRKK